MKIDEFNEHLCKYRKKHWDAIAPSLVEMHQETWDEIRGSIRWSNIYDAPYVARLLGVKIHIDNDMTVGELSFYCLAECEQMARKDKA